MSAEPGIARIPAESRPVEERIILIGSYLLSASTLFFFISFLFAFFYLRELNSNGLWAGPKPGHHVPVPTGSGIAVLVCVLASVVLVRACLTAAGARLLWPLGGSALLLGLAAVAIQCWQYTDLGFGTNEGGYASVFLGWTGFFAIFAFGAMVWLEMILATGRRTGSWVMHDLASFWVFWATLGIVEVAAFILLYVVK
jgi:UDP-N-acetylmuramyl pentapeptide phosphotransferase/UDP-N-acetylglucosamine-1-phosphate transferase